MFEYNVHHTLCSVVSDGFVISAVLWILIESADGNQLFDVMGTVGGTGSPWPGRSEIGQDSWIARLGTEWEKGETGITGERQGEGREEYDRRMKKRDEDEEEKRKSATRRSFKQERKELNLKPIITNNHPWVVSYFHMVIPRLKFAAKYYFLFLEAPIF